MKIALVGAGFTALAAAYRLSQRGHKVVLLEKESLPGGLAVGYKEDGWQWSLEKHYHHWFTNDHSILELAKELHHNVLTKRPKTSVYIDGFSYQLDSPLDVLRFPRLPLIDRLRMGTVLAGLKYNPFWKPLEKIEAATALSKLMGKKSYELLWEPQLNNKFGSYAKDIPLAWFWARVKKRTPSLAYPEGGFLAFANRLTKKIEDNNGKVLFNTEVKEIISGKNVQVKFSIGNWKLEIGNYDAVVVTLPSFLFLKIAPQLPEIYKEKLTKLKGLGAINLILRLKKQFLKDNTYWLSICDPKSPIMAIVEHTNFMDNKNYDGEHILYVANYLPMNHPYMHMSKNQLLQTYHPYLLKINKQYQSTIIDYQVFIAPFAQPIIPLSYSKEIPPLTTPLPHVYLANIQQVYPWDRGTNYAVELGEKVAKLVDGI